MSQNRGNSTAFIEAEQYHREVLTLPLYPTLQDEQIEYVLETLKKVLTNNDKN